MAVGRLPVEWIEAMLELSLLASHLVAIVLSASASVEAAEEPWLAGAFTADAAVVARAAAKIESIDGSARPEGGGNDAVMLFRDDHFAFDPDGRMTYTRRWVYRILTPAGLDDWSASEVKWSPWHQAKPRLRVRVIDAGGGEQWLAASDVSDLAAAGAGLDGEQRLLRAVLPVAVGSVIEEEVVVRDTEPLFAGGVSIKHVLAMPISVHRGRLTLVAPTTMPLRHRVRMVRLLPFRTVVDEQARLTFDYAGLPAARSVAAGLPFDAPRHPHVTFSTGDSWSSVAGAYARELDDLLTESETRAVRRWLPNRFADTELDRIADVVEGLRGNVRYQASAFGSSPLLPLRPLSVLKRGTGDSKDLAVVLVAALRAEGIPAHVALVNAGFGMDVEPELPGLGRFNHALVYVPVRKPVWIDPGDRFSRIGELASDRQGRLALVTSPSSRQLVGTPVALAVANRTTTEIDVYLAEDGPARVVETSTYVGAADHRQRLVISQVDTESRRLGYQAYLEAAYRAEAVGEIEETVATDLSGPFRLRLEALRAGRGWTSAEEAALAIDFGTLITTLPRPLLLAGSERRQSDFVFHEPFVSEWRYRVHPPAGMKARALPRDLSLSLGSGRLTQAFRVKDSVVHADFRLESGPRRITADQFQAFQDAVQNLLREPTLVLWFDQRRQRRR